MSPDASSEAPSIDGSPQEAASQQALTAEGVTYAYLGQTQLAIEVGHLSIPEGEAVLIAGKSGGGKSTLVNCLNGIIPHVYEGGTGRVKIFDDVVRETRLAQISTMVGTLLQDPETQVINYIVKEEVAFGPENLCMEPDEIKKRVGEAMSIAGIMDLRDRETSNLSGGELQRVCLAGVLAMRPRILILDEPTSNIDPEGTRRIFEVLRSLKRKNTLLIVEHKVERVLPFVDRILLVDGGRVRLDVPKEEIIERCEELRAAGIEVPEYYFHAKRLGMDRATIDDVKREIQARRIPLVMPERVETARPVLQAQARVSAGEKVLVDSGIEVGEGQVLAVMGQNGAGKSMLFNAIMGFLDKRLAFRLRLSVEGKDLSTAEMEDRGRYIAYVPQSFDLSLVSSTVEDEITYSWRKRGARDYGTRAEGFLRLFSLTAERKRDPLTLSVGQRRRVVMASALASGVKVILLDEPTSGQDFYHKEVLGRELQQFKAMGYSFCVITHDSRFVYWYADKVAVLSKGSKVLEGTPESVFGQSDQYSVDPPSDFYLRH